MYELIILFFDLYNIFKVLMILVVTVNSKHSIFVIKNSAGLLQNTALYKNAFICSKFVSSLQINKVFIIGGFPVKFK